MIGRAIEEALRQRSGKKEILKKSGPAQWRILVFQKRTSKKR